MRAVVRCATIARLAIARLAIALGACRGAERAALDVPPARVLGEPINEFPAPFTGPIRVVELPDGRVLAYDAREGRLVLLDLAAGTQEEAARKGSGPLEFRSGLTFLAAPGDSAWLFDLMQGRILVFSPAGAPVRSFRVTEEGDSPGRVTAPWLRAIAADGAWYGNARGMAGLAGFSDSAAVVRVERTAVRHDTLAMLGVEGGLRTTTGVNSRLTSFDPSDAWGVFADGTVLVVRGATYSAEIVRRDGTRERSGPLAHRRVVLERADGERVLDSIARMVGLSVASTLAQMPLSRGTAPPMGNLELPEPLPEHWPVLVHESIHVDGRDRAWVGVRESAFDSTGIRYDLLDRDGKWVDAVRMPRGFALVAFGRGTLYVARRDADDLLWLQRYALP
jgi:hypothetical protein